MKWLYALASLSVLIPINAAVAGALPLPTAKVSPIELTRASARWYCVKKGPCWTPCRGPVCRRACFRLLRQCARSLR